MEKEQKFFKIVDPQGHHGLVYHNGYNEDPLPFNPSGDCEPGGIYFSSRDIFLFYDYGTELYEVEPVGEIYENPGEPKKYKAHALNMKYVGKIDEVNTIKYLLKNGADIHADDDYALRSCVKKGYLKVVKYLIEQGADIHTRNDSSLRFASEYGRLETVKYLVEQGANIHANDDEALINAALSRNLDVVKYLVEQGANIHVNNDEALRRSVEYDHLEVVKYLKTLY